MSELITKLEKIGNSLLESVETKPVKTIVVMILVVWLIARLIKSIRG